MRSMNAVLLDGLSKRTAHVRVAMPRFKAASDSKVGFLDQESRVLATVYHVV